MGSPGNPDISVPDDPSYVVSDGAELQLTVVIGEGQVGLSTVLLDTTPVVSNQEAITDQPIGAGQDVRGKTLVVDTIVNDVNPLTNRVTVTYELTGGPAPQTFVASGTASAAGAATFVEAMIALE